MLDINCPLPEELTDIPAATCPFDFDQIVRFGSQIRQDVPSFANLTAIQTKANWDALINADGDPTELGAKIVLSPIFAGFTIPGSEPLTAGGNDNTTFNGIPDYFGEGTVTATGTMRSIESAIKQALDDLTQYSLSTAIGTSFLTMYFFNRLGYIFCLDTFAGVPVYNFGLGTVGTEGLNSKNINTFRMAFGPYWDRNLISVKPNFDPLTLAPAA